MGVGWAITLIKSAKFLLLYKVMFTQDPRSKVQASLKLILPITSTLVKRFSGRFMETGILEEESRSTCFQSSLRTIFQETQAYPES